MVAGSFKGSPSKYPSLYRPRLVTKASSMVFFLSLRFHGQNPVQRGCRDVQPPGNGNVVFHVLVNIASAYDKHMRAAQEIPAHINAAFMFLRDCVIEKKRKIQGRANRGKTGFVNCPAILRRLFGIRIVIAAPRGSNVC
ncbi:hypothetical protein CSCA_1912 [Clostridium scatologenes]|uniref:Uncharacterized protein n=1 Tax=Clostridium scatologenes TaxID=1548 RepID=A0A0E3JYM1_CLOSL|nr:hypothetical protein CSCA_1912 [Clostridium scatologenes]